MSSNIISVDGELVEMNRLEAQLEAFKKEFSNRVYDVSTKAGLDEAKAARRLIVTLRTDTERERVSRNKKYVEAKRWIDDAAKRITTVAREVEKPIDDLIKAEEQRKEQEKAEREAAEKARVERIKGLIEELRVRPQWGDTAADILAMIERVKGMKVIEGVFFEFTDEAALAQGANLAHLSAAYAAACETERRQAEAQAALEAAQAQAAVERAEREAREAAERAEREAREAAERAVREAEQLELARLRRQLREREEAERAAAEIQEREARAEAERLEREAAIAAAIEAAIEDRDEQQIIQLHPTPAPALAPVDAPEADYQRARAAWQVIDEDYGQAVTEEQFQQNWEIVKAYFVPETLRG